MRHTYINSLNAPVKDEKRVNNYAWPTIFSDSVQIADSIPRHRKFAQLSGGLIGPGLVVSDTYDLFLFDQALYEGRLLKQATMDEAFTPIKLNNGTYAEPEPFLGKTAFGLGWFIYIDDPSRKIVLHTGKQGGIITAFVRDLSKKRTFILFDNSESSGLNNTISNAMRVLDNTLLINLKQSLAFAYGKDIAKRGIDYALCRFNQLKPDTAHYYLNHFEMDYVGHQLIDNNRKELGIETLRLLTQINQDSWFPYFSYGKELLAQGKKEEAAMALHKSLVLSPDNKEVKQILDHIK